MTNSMRLFGGWFAVRFPDVSAHNEDLKTIFSYLQSHGGVWDKIPLRDALKIGKEYLEAQKK